MGEAEVMLRDSKRGLTPSLRECFAVRGATTVPIDIDTENYQWMSGPPSTSQGSRSGVLEGTR